MNEQKLSKKLPTKPYCTDELGYVVIRPMAQAIKKRYLQINPPCMVNYLIFDVDNSQAVLSWFDGNLPLPSWTAQNRTNGHAHIVYELLTPICITHLASQKAIKYLASVQAGLTEKLNADVGYTGLITKNPLHEDWRVNFWTEQAYTLDELADYVDLRSYSRLTAQQRQSGLGRNCTLFDNVRKWAYNAVRTFRSKSFDEWYMEVLNNAVNANNAFLEPLPLSEVKATAKSIARFCWKNDPYKYNEFVERQKSKGTKGGKVSKRSKSEKSERTMKPWEELGISRRTYYNDKKIK